MIKPLFRFLLVIVLLSGANSSARADLVVETKAQGSKSVVAWGEELVYALSATVRDTNAVSATPILDPQWHWSVEKVEYQSEKESPWVEKTTDCVIRFEQEDLTRSNASERLTFANSGYWRLQVRATLFYRATKGDPILKVSGVGSGV
jgi:hypothetical protein